MVDPTGEADRSALRLDFDRRLMLQFRGSTITSDAGLLAYRELDHALHLTDTAADKLADARAGKNGRHRLAGLLRQSVFERLAGYDLRCENHGRFQHPLPPPFLDRIRCIHYYPRHQNIVESRLTRKYYRYKSKISYKGIPRPTIW